MSARALIVIRPEPGNTQTIARARAAGMEAHGFPLFTLRGLAWDAVPPDGFAGLLAGSANVFRLGGRNLDMLRALPVHAVGEATAVAAHAAGFALAGTGAGGLQPLIATLPPGRYLRLAGEDHVPLAPPDGVAIETRIAYAATPLPFPPALLALLRGPVLVALHSGEAARHFAEKCAESGVSTDRIALACLAPRIGEMAGSGWHDIGIAALRTDDALLALARQMCETL